MNTLTTAQKISNISWIDLENSMDDPPVLSKPHLVIIDEDAWGAGAPHVWGTLLPLGFDDDTIRALEDDYEAGGGTVTTSWTVT